MTKPKNPPAEPTLRQIFAAKGIESSTDDTRRRLQRHYLQIVDSRKAYESAIGLAMITSSIPGIEVVHIT